MIYSRNKPPKWWPQNENAPYHHDAIGGTEKLTNTSADFTGSRAQHGNIFAPMPGKRAPNFGLALPTTDATLAPWPSACCTVAGAGYVATLATVATKKRTCTAAPRRGTVRPGASHTIEVAGNLPDSEVFSRPEFSNAALCRVHGFGAGSAYPQGRQHGYFHVTIPSPTRWPSQSKGGFQSQVGAETMTTPPVASRCAAPTSKATQAAIPSTEAQAFALLQAVTSTNLAGFYLRRDNIAQARRKLRQALQALSALEVQHA